MIGAMKALFREIRAGDIEAVRSRLEANPSLVAAIAKAPPKKDDGQPPLQVAIKGAHFDIAHELLHRGADVNFIETSAISSWRAPVLHDAIRAAVFSSRFGRNRALPGEPPNFEVLNKPEDFDRAFAVLQRLLDTGADVNKPDSYGNPALRRATLDAKQLLTGAPSTELMVDLGRVFSALLAAGADSAWVDPRSGRLLAEDLQGTSLRDLIL